MIEYKERDIILCTVTDIVKTTVFVETEDGIKGSIVFSEIAPGRIRNIREYVVPKKVIVCKILSIRDNHLFLSLRRVNGRERKELLEEYKKEKSFQGILKKMLGEKAGHIIKEIKQTQPITEFFEQAKEAPKILEKYFNKEQIEQITKMIVDKKEKEKEIKKEFILSCNQPDGINRIKKILLPYANIIYLGSSKFQIKNKSINLKQADSEISHIMETIEKQAKKEKCEFSVTKLK